MFRFLFVLGLLIAVLAVAVPVHAFPGTALEDDLLIADTSDDTVRVNLDDGAAGDSVDAPDEEAEADVDENGELVVRDVEHEDNNDDDSDDGDDDEDEDEEEGDDAADQDALDVGDSEEDDESALDDAPVDHTATLASQKELLKHKANWDFFRRFAAKVKKFVAPKIKKIAKVAKQVVKDKVLKHVKGKDANRLEKEINHLGKKHLKEIRKAQAAVKKAVKKLGTNIRRRHFKMAVMSVKIAQRCKGKKSCVKALTRKVKDLRHETLCRIKNKSRKARVTCLARLWAWWAKRDAKNVSKLKKFDGKIEDPEDLSVIAPMIRLLNQIMNNPDAKPAIKPLSDSDLDKAYGTSRDSVMAQFEAANALNGESDGSDPLTDPSLDAISPAKIHDTNTNPLMIMQKGMGNAPVMWDSRSITQIIAQLHSAAGLAVEKALQESKGLGSGDPELTKTLMAMYPFMQYDKPEDRLSVDDIMRLTQG